MSTSSDSIYFHAPCFDGLVCAAIAQDHLETTRGWTIANIVPITYPLGDGHGWRSAAISPRAAVVDFLYHPRSTFWVDHHSTTFRTDDAREHFERSVNDPDRTLFFDGECPAAAALLWRSIGAEVSEPARYEEMVKWATITDSAGYRTVEESIFGDEPALRIANTLGRTIDAERLTAVLQALRWGSVDEVAASELIAKPFAQLRPRIEAGLNTIARRLHIEDDGMIASYEAVIDAQAETLPRYGVFLPRGAVKTVQLWAVENRPVVGGHFQNRSVGLSSA
jgi:hypothetical protein